MKKVTALLLLLLFLMANSGMAVSIHYCKGKLSSVKFLFGSEHPCKCNKKSMKKGCCKNEVTILKANDELAKANPIAIKNPVSHIHVPVPAEKLLLPVIYLHHPSRGFFYPRPYKPKCPIFLLDKVFLI